MKRYEKYGLLTLGFVAVAHAVWLYPQMEKRSYLGPAAAVAAWLSSAGIETEQGKKWPADPDDPTTVSTDLYNGMGGVVLFFLEIYRATGDVGYLAEAESGADYLLATLPDKLTTDDQAGLYTGVAGVGFVLEETYQATKEQKYREGSRRCVGLLEEKAQTVGSGVEWGEVTDIISGGAGIGLFLLYASKEMELESARDLAVRAGDRLLEFGIEDKGGLKWQMRPGYERLMPNFAHGTAGISYFLACLYKKTDEKRFLKGACAGGNYLLNISNKEGLIYHHEPGGEDLFYLGWRHGPAGTGRLYFMLWQQTGDIKWQVALHNSAHVVVQSGIPEKRTPGFWNNVSQCCGSAGLADYFLNLYRTSSRGEYLNFSHRLIEDILSRGSRDELGLRWEQAEHRTQPDLEIAQTGYMQGAAGIGMSLLRWDAFERVRRPGIVLPDSPFY